MDGAGDDGGLLPVSRDMAGAALLSPNMSQIVGQTYHELDHLVRHLPL